MSPARLPVPPLGHSPKAYHRGPVLRRRAQRRGTQVAQGNGLQNHHSSVRIRPAPPNFFHQERRRRSRQSRASQLRNLRSRHLAPAVLVVPPWDDQKPCTPRMILVIRQTFSAITCTMFTAESQSDSRAAKIERDEEPVTISYNYTNRSKATIRHRSPIHDGAAHLRVVLTPTKMLEGEYWTGRCTTGTMKLNFRTKELFESFPES